MNLLDMSCRYVSLIFYLQVFTRLKSAAFYFIVKEIAIYYSTGTVRQSNMTKNVVCTPLHPAEIGTKLNPSGCHLEMILMYKDTGKS